MQIVFGFTVSSASFFLSSLLLHLTNMSYRDMKLTLLNCYMFSLEIYFSVFIDTNDVSISQNKKRNYLVNKKYTHNSTQFWKTD